MWVVYTHIGGCRELWNVDIESIRAIYSIMRAECLYFPIVTFSEEEMEITAYRINSKGIEKEGLDVV